MQSVQDAVVSYGERLSSDLLSRVLRANEIPAVNVDARRCIITDGEFTHANVLTTESNEATRRELQPIIAEGVMPVLGGYIASTITGETTTLGRGGSDYSAAIVGSALGAKEIQIWTDVTGVLTADPRVVARARTISRLSYSEAAELAYFGAKVLHPRTIQPAIESNIPVRICNSHEPEREGTLVCADTETSPTTVKAIAHKSGVTTIQITSTRMLGAYGFLRAIFEICDQHRIVVDVVTTSEVSVSMTIDDTSRIDALIADLEKLGTVGVEFDRTIVCVVGEGLRQTPGIAGRIFRTISDINVSLISQGASSINLTFVVDDFHAEETVKRLHAEFFESENQFVEQKAFRAAVAWRIA
jgi:aspartate kinase